MNPAEGHQRAAADPVFTQFTADVLGPQGGKGGWHGHRIEATGALTADAVALQARKFAETDDHPHPADEPARPASNVVSLTERRLAQLPADTRPAPSVAAYDQLLRHRRTAEGNKP